MLLSSVWLVLFVLLEFLLCTFWRNALGPYASPVAVCLSSWLVGWQAMRSFRYHGWQAPTAQLPAQRLLGLALPVLGLSTFVPRLNRVFAQSPLATYASDIIPSIRIYLDRLLHGRTVYSYFTPELGYKLYPTYLPALWFPFLLPELIGFDYRWLAVGVLALVLLGTYYTPLLRQDAGWGELGLKMILPLILLQGLLKMDVGLFGYSVESLISGYYLLVAYSVLGRSSWLQVLALTLCLLSRFSLVLWIPLWLALLWQQAGRHAALRILTCVVLSISLLYVLPFLQHDWQALALGQQTYLRAALADWQLLNHLTGQPDTMNHGLGLATYFYTYAPGTLLQRINLIRLVQAGSCLVVVLAAAWYWWARRPAVDYRLYALVVLKVYLATFYAFVQVPYSYLFSVVIFLSLPLVLHARLAQK